MAQNVEIKASLSEQEFADLRKRVCEITSIDCVLEQTDTFFNAPRDRLKLREFTDGTAELIAYSRNDQSDAKLSDYVRTSTAQPQRLKDSLERSIGIRGVVTKRRELYLIEQTRIHLDEVEGLGKFVELEVVLSDQQSHEFGRQIADELVVKLGIKPESFISCAYIDLLEDALVQNGNLSS